MSVHPAPTFRFGTFEVDVAACEVRKHGLRIKLQDQPFQLLVLLLRHPGQVITRDELRHTLWSDHTFVDFDRGLNRAMNKLRSALCDSAESPRFIETLHRRGYRFIAPVAVHRHEDDGTGPIEGESFPAGAPSRQEFIASDKRTWIPIALRLARKSSNHLAALVILATSVGAVYYHLQLESRMVAGSPTPALAPRRSIAVLGFKNLSARAEDAWVSTALSDWLTTQLSAGGHLRLIPAENVARAKIELSPVDVESLSGTDLTRVSKNLATDFLVAGSYAILNSGSGSQVRLDLRLLDARTGNIMEAVSETGTEAHLFDLVLKAGERLRGALGVQPLSSAEAAEVAIALPSSPDAARLYSEGLERLRIFDALGARNLFERAIAVEPRYALSHSALASAWAALGYDDMARTEAKRAFDLSSNLPRADRLLVAARYHEISKEWEQAVDIYRALFEFFPDSLDYGLALADAQLDNGRSQEAKATLRQLENLPAPLGDDARIDLAYARTAESLGDFKTDLACATKAAEQARTLGASLLLAQARADQAWALANLGRADDAAAAAHEAGAIFAKVGDKRGLARSKNFDGILMQNQGDAVSAKKRFEDALAIFRAIGSRLGVAAELDNLGDVMFALGDLDRSRRDYEAAMAIYREVGHKDGICLTKGAIGSVLLARGDDNASTEIFQEAVDICTRLGDRSKSAIALLGLGRALRLQGKTSEARTAESEAVSAFEEIGDRQSADRARLTLAELLLDEGQLQQARFTSSSAADEFAKQKAARDAAFAYGILSQVLLREGDLQGAQGAIQEATAYLAKCSDREAELMVAISAARVQAVSGGGARDDAARTLQEIATKANHLGFVPYELEPRLARAEIEVNLGNRAGARTELEALRKEASDRGFGLIAHKAAGDLKNLTPVN
jgi:eukaryotic-like serine/threonine-protein kinase